jgi:CHASE3 domain sensor protein
MRIKKTFMSIFIIGIIVLSILSILGLIYITKMNFSSKKLTNTQKNIARLTTVLLWIQIGLIIVASIVQTYLNEY